MTDQMSDELKSVIWIFFGLLGAAVSILANQGRKPDKNRFSLDCMFVAGGSGRLEGVSVSISIE